MSKINPLLYITDTDPINLSARSASSWYETEYTTTEDRESLRWMQAQGWQVESTERIVRDDGLVRESWTKWYLKRRTMKGERVLNALIQDFTSAYNEGRQLNDQRYDDIVALYTALSSTTQDEIVDLKADEDSYIALSEQIIGSLDDDFGDHEDDISGDLDEYGVSQRERINRSFDARVSEARSGLVSRGMYNTTIWTVTQAGIEREREVALNDLEDRLLAQRTGLKERLYGKKGDMRLQVLSARDRLFSGQHSNGIQREELRNRVITALNNFMERRNDGYPDLGAIGGLASDFGAGTVEGIAP